MKRLVYVKWVPVYRTKVEHPTECQNWRSKITFKIIHNMCQFGDKQYVKLQEIQEHLPAYTLYYHLKPNVWVL